MRIARRIAFFAAIILLGFLCTVGLDLLTFRGSPRYWAYPVHKACARVKPGMTLTQANRELLAFGEPRGMELSQGTLAVVGDGRACILRLDASENVVVSVHESGASSAGVY